jgi:hypothetical protein
MGGTDTSRRKGFLTFTTELSGGRDASNPVFTELHQAEYLHASMEHREAIPEVSPGRSRREFPDHRRVHVTSATTSPILI